MIEMNIKQINTNAQTKTDTLLLGGSGFIGTGLHKKMVEGKSLVRAVSSSEIDLSKQEGVDKLVSCYSDETTIVFLAAAKRNQGDDLVAYEKNVNIAKTIIRSLDKKPCSGLIYLSSAAVYGERIEQKMYDEKSRISPTSYYGAAKVAIEGLLTVARINDKMKWLTIVRPSTVYSTSTQGTYCPGGFLIKAKSGGEINLWGDGSEKRDFCLLDDLVEGIIKIIDKKEDMVVNATCGESIRFKDITSKLSERLTYRLTHKYRSYEKVDHTYDSAAFKKILGREPTKTQHWLEANI